MTSLSDFESEVVEPIRWLRRTRYLETDAREIAAAVDEKIRPAVHEIVSDDPPQVVVFVSNPQPHWFRMVENAEGSLAVLEQFRSGTGETIVRVNGQVPRGEGELILECTALANMECVLRVPGGATELRDSSVRLEWQGDLLEYSLTSIAPDVLVAVSGGLSLDPDQKWAIWRLSPEHFALREA